MKEMLIDYHTHHERCGHATGKLREYIEQAIKIGLHEFGVSDHMPVIHMERGKVLAGTAMELHQLEEYVEEALRYKQEYKNEINIKVGLEADYIDGYEEKIEQLLAPYPFDYLIGSVHFLGEWDFSDSRQMEGWKKKPIDDIFNEYYQTVQKAAKSGIYDIVGHFDGIKRFGHIPTQDISGLIDQTLATIKEADMAMEVNTSGLFKVVKEIFPAPAILQRAISLNIPITLGSDAHKPEHVYVGIEEGLKILRELGLKKVATFENRGRKMVEIGV